MGQSVLLLENALRSWESFRLIKEYGRRRSGYLGKSEPISPDVLHWRELRPHLLHVPHRGFDHAKFCSDDPVFGHLPIQLASWIASSRRVFHVTEELMLRFAAADYSNYCWSDLLWPFDSFAISFDGMLGNLRPDCTEYGNFMLITSMRTLCPDYPYGEPEGFEIALFVDGQGPRTQFSGKLELGADYLRRPETLLAAKDHLWLDENVQKRRWSYLERHAGEIADSFHSRCDLNGLPPGYDIPTPFRKDERINSASPIKKVIAGLCLYLEALPPGVGETSWGTPTSIKAPRGVRKIITEETKVCEVMDFHTISPETMTLFPETLRKGPAYTVTPHWRRAHYRRAPGQGKNPDAPRTIQVKSALVHKDQLPEGAVPGGAISTIR